jgi:hypothetical protein
VTILPYGSSYIFLRQSREICEMEFPYVDGTKKECLWKGELSRCLIHDENGFRCRTVKNNLNFAFNVCDRVTPTGRISYKKCSYGVLDRFKLTFFRRDILNKIDKVRELVNGEQG